MSNSFIGLDESLNVAPNLENHLFESFIEKRITRKRILFKEIIQSWDFKKCLTKKVYEELEKKRDELPPESFRLSLKGYFI